MAKVCGACGTKTRRVSNGVSERLNYDYCDKCKDVAKDSTSAISGMAALIADSMKKPGIISQLIASPIYMPTPVVPLPPPTSVPMSFTVAGFDSNGVMTDVMIPDSTPCHVGGHFGSGIPAKRISAHGGPSGKYQCNCGEVRY